jgi:hypothetical protein
MSKEYKKPKAKVTSLDTERRRRATNGDRQELRRSTDDSSFMAAKALDAYMRFRAEQEGVEYQLSPKFFADAIEQGCEMCFGVTFQNGQLLDDEEQPELFRRWKEYMAVA